MYSTRPLGVPVKTVESYYDHPDYIAVFKHPYFFVTDKSGSFDLKNLPPGTYTLEAWQEKYGTVDQTVTIGPKESKTVNFVFKAAPSGD